MNLLLPFLIVILITSIIVIAVYSNKKEEPPVKTCNGYLYNNLCMENCGDKYVDESKKICYDTIPDGMFLDGKKLVSSCEASKYIDGIACVSDCITRPNLVIDGKNCVETCNKYLNYVDNKFECKDSCEYYSIDNKFKRFGIHDNICISPSNAITLMNMKNLFMSNDGNFIVDVVDGPEEKIFLKNSNYKTLLPLRIGNIGNTSFKKLLVSPSGNTYGEVYNTNINIYTVDVFNNEFYYKTNPVISLYPSSLVGSAIEIENCIMYDDSNYLLVLKKSLTDRTIYSFYHIYIDVNVPVSILIKTYEILNNSTFKFYHAIFTKDYQNDYKICYVLKDSNTIKTQLISYNITLNNINNISISSNLQDTTIEELNANDYDLLDLNIIYFSGVVLYYLNDKRQSPLGVPILRVKSYLNLSIIPGEEEIGFVINSKPSFSVSRQKAYYSVYNNKSVIIYEFDAGYATDSSVLLPNSNPIKFFTPYETNPEVVLASNMNNTSLLCSITEINAENIPTRKELHKIDLTASPISSELLISS